MIWLSEVVTRPGGPTVMVPRLRVPRVPLKITCKPLTGSSRELRKQNGPRFGTEFAHVIHVQSEFRWHRDRHGGHPVYFPGTVQLKFAASSMLPEPLYFATCG